MNFGFKARMEEENNPEVKPNKAYNLAEMYDKHYKKLLIIPFLLLLISFIVIGAKVATTGDFINKDVSLKGGVTITIPIEKQVNTNVLQNKLLNDLTGYDVSVSSLNDKGKQIALLISSDIDGTQEDQFNFLISSLESNLETKLEKGSYSTEIIGASLGASFFREVLVAMLFAFLFMGVVVFIYFRSLVPSGAVILAAFSDIVIAVGVVNIIGLKISTAGIAAFLMLIGYSVDTNILLSTRVLKRKEGTIIHRIKGAFSTGIVMTTTTVTALTLALIFTKSDVIRQIMTILLIGLLADLINTWIQNAGILRMHLEKKNETKN